MLMRGAKLIIDSKMACQASWDVLKLSDDRVRRQVPFTEKGVLDGILFRLFDSS